MIVAVCISTVALVYAIAAGSVLAMAIAALALVLAVAGFVREVNRRER